MNVSRAQLLLRLGLAFVFLYAAISSFVAPENWIGFIPGWVPFDPEFLLKMHAVFEILLASWLLWGAKIKWAAWLSALSLFAILVGTGLDEITFRDVGLMSSAVALAMLDIDD